MNLSILLGSDLYNRAKIFSEENMGGRKITHLLRISTQMYLDISEGKGYASDEQVESLKRQLAKALAEKEKRETDIENICKTVKSIYPESTLCVEFCENCRSVCLANRNFTNCQGFKLKKIGG